MRTLPTGVDTLLKSRSMIGANKPSYSLLIEGLTKGIDFNSLGTTTYDPLGAAATDTFYASSHELTDGRVLVVWGDGDKIRQGYAASAEALFADDCLTSKTDLLTGLEDPTCILSYTDAGLFLIVSYVQQGSDKVSKSLLYKSDLGDGSDWALFTTINSLDWNSATNGKYDVKIGVTAIYKTGSRYIVQVPLYKISFGFCCGYYAVYGSADLETWVKVFDETHGAGGGGLVSQCSSNFVEVGDMTYWACTDWSSGKHFTLFSSTDGFDSNVVEVFRIVVDTEPYRSVFPIGSCTLAEADNQLLIIGVREGVLSVAACAAADVADATKYSIIASTDTDSFQDGASADHSSGSQICQFSNGEYAIWGEDRIVGVDAVITDIPIKSISISRNKNMAASLEVLIDNKNGDWSPDGTTHKEILWPNTVVTLQQGYGTELVNTFKGLIDRIEMTTFPQELKISCRDYLKYALDQLVTKAVEGGNTHVLTYTAQTVEYIVTDLASLCGLTLLETIYTTGITVAEITFSWCSYADAFQQLADLVGADFGCDEDGKFYFVKDYIPDTPTIAYTFQEGEDIVSLGYTIDDADIYQKVVCYGQKADGTTVFAQTNYTSRVYYNVLANKYMKIDAGTSAQTVAEAQALSDRAEILMRSRVRICTFAAVAVPWLQVGDVIQVIETSTTISEAYRITDLSTIMEPSGGYTMQITCYHHSYTA